LEIYFDKDIIAGKSPSQSSFIYLTHSPNMVKPLSFKGEKPKKRKRPATEPNNDEDGAPSSKALVTTTGTAEDGGDDDAMNWVTADAVNDIAGPIMIVLPSEPPTCIACDTNGKIFCSAIENMVEDDARTAEPHDVRQVFVANRVAGTESFSFKGHHGRYLGCELGQLSATKEAVSPVESFTCVAVPDNPGAFAIQTSREQFLTIEEKKGTSLRGDAEEINFNATFRIRMQARFKPKLKATKEEKALSKITRKELEDAVGRRLEDDEVKMLKKARREGNYHEAMLDVKVKGKHDKFA
jgi:protein FRG1